MGILITDQLTQLSTESEVLNEVAKNPGIIRKYLQDLTPSLLGFLVQLMIAVIILLVGSRMIKMLVKMVRRFLERGKVEAGWGFLSEFFCEICALFCAGNDYSGAVWRDDKLCDCRAGVRRTYHGTGTAGKPF